MFDERALAKIRFDILSPPFCKMILEHSLAFWWELHAVCGA